MSNQYPNPVRGYVPCAHCGSVATVHCVGEGKLMATGETPKNKRNVGKQYYRCPSCGNQNSSKKITEYIEKNKVDNETDIINAHASGNANEGVTKALESVTAENSETNKTAVSNAYNANLEGGENTLSTSNASGNANEGVTKALESVTAENSETSKTAVSNAYNANPEDDDETDDGWSRVLPWVVALIVLAGAGWLAWKWIASASQQEDSKEVTYVWQ